MAGIHLFRVQSAQLKATECILLFNLHFRAGSSTHFRVLCFDSMGQFSQ